VKANSVIDDILAENPIESPQINNEETVVEEEEEKIFRKKIKGLAIKSSPFYYFIFIPVVSFLLIQFYARKVQYP